MGSTSTEARRYAAVRVEQWLAAHAFADEEAARSFAAELATAWIAGFLYAQEHR